MAVWEIVDGQLTLTNLSGRMPPTADDIFRSVIEGERVWTDVEPGQSGAAVALKFSRYPAIPHLVLDQDSIGARIGFEAGLPDSSTVVLGAAALQVGHFVVNGRWFPLEPDVTRAVVKLAAKVDARSDGRVLSLRGILDLKMQCAAGLVQDRLPLDAVALARMVPVGGGSPEGVRATLYPYQLDGWRWLQFVASEGLGGLLADEMGLGKTLQVISLLSDPRSQAIIPALVVAPGSLLENWCRELRKFAPALTVLKHHGSGRSGSPIGFDGYDVVVTSYETVVRDGALMGIKRWGAVVLDEAQNIRNPNATRTKAVKSLHRNMGIAVTGTPLENRLLDVWSIMDFACPGYLDTELEFTRRFIDSRDDASALEPLISPLILRRLVADVAKDLPPRIDIPQLLELDESAAREYEDLRLSIQAEFGRSASLVALTKLRMFCAHPSLVIDHLSGTEFIKTRRLEELAEEIFEAGEKLLVFTSYTKMADRVVVRLRQLFGVFVEALDGRLPIDDRQPLIDKFSVTEGSGALVLNPRAGGAGLNITAANHVIHYNPEWNPALEDQASARSFRRGQERPVTVHRLLIAGTVEEVIAERLQRKRDLARAAIVGVEGGVEDMADIVDALSRSPAAKTGITI